MDDPRRTQARQLRVETRMSLAQLRNRFGVSRDTMADWLWGLPVPEWTRRPNAKDELRDRAVALRRAGRTVPDIASELSVSRSTAYLWTRHLPLEPSPERATERQRRHMAEMREARWGPYRVARDAERAATWGRESDWVGALSEREVRLLGAVAYWCEGTKSKPWQPNRCRVTFINSDPVLIRLFLRFMDLFGLDRAALKYRISIHESADWDAAGRWWAVVAEVPYEIFCRPTLKKHNPTTVRHNVGAPYRGCLIIDVPRSRELYWRIEGIMQGIGLAAGSADGARM
ncbi:resolvase [Krasilnikovia sp. MM14-A1259]|uniref:resolvase n=1 Tax=Krasilnikovia sp. MM14-A1259 TaxID=3373539 RepID=UPI003824E745